jgi:homogentisate 1,2-dioxygenase
MCDTFHPLRLTKLAQELDDGKYAYSWATPAEPAQDADADPAGVTSHF